MIGSLTSGEGGVHPRRNEAHKELRDWLQDHNLSDIYCHLVTFEFHQPDHLRVMREEDLDTLADSMGLRFGKKGRFLHAVESLRNKHRLEAPRALRIVISQEEQTKMDALARKATDVKELFNEMARRLARVDDDEKQIKQDIKEQREALICQIRKESNQATKNAESSARNLRVVLKENMDFLVTQQTLVRQCQEKCDELIESHELSQRSNSVQRAVDDTMSRLRLVAAPVPFKFDFVGDVNIHVPKVTTFRGPTIQIILSSALRDNRSRRDRSSRNRRSSRERYRSPSPYSDSSTLCSDDDEEWGFSDVGRDEGAYGDDYKSENRFDFKIFVNYQDTGLRSEKRTREELMADWVEEFLVAAKDEQPAKIDFHLLKRDVSVYKTQVTFDFQREDNAHFDARLRTDRRQKHKDDRAQQQNRSCRHSSKKCRNRRHNSRNHDRDGYIDHRGRHRDYVFVDIKMSVLR